MAVQKWVFVAICCLLATSGILARATNGRKFANRKNLATKSPEICTTKECTLAAGDILSAMDVRADPCQDFVQFACGTWLKENPIPHTTSRWGRFDEIAERVERTLERLLRLPKMDDEAKSIHYVKDMYAACMDEEAIEAKGYDFFLNKLVTNELGGWPMITNEFDNSKYLVSASSGYARRNYMSSLFVGSAAHQDILDVKRTVLYVDQPSLVLPQEMYLDQEEFADYFAAYREFAVGIGELFAGLVDSPVTIRDIRKSVDDIIGLETILASIMTPQEDRRNATEMYNPTTVEDFTKDYPNFDLGIYFDYLFTDTNVGSVPSDGRVINRDPKYFKQLNERLEGDDILDRTAADYVFLRIAMAFAQEGPKELADLAFEFNSALSGATAEGARSGRCVTVCQNDAFGFGFAVGNLYVKEEFGEATKLEVSAMIEDIRIAFKELVDQSDWMDEETQVLAQEKADAVIKLIGYPDWEMDDDELDQLYEGVRVPQRDTHLDNILGVIYKSVQREMDQLPNVPKRDIWLGNPSIVNAWYAPEKNSITFPAAILQKPFFRKDVPRYLSYGGIGVIMGHELTHGFDDQGRQFDKEGSVTPWWSDETVAAFTERAQCFIDMYDNYTVPQLVPILGEDAHLNGAQTQGENIADNGGLREAFLAYTDFITLQNDGVVEPALPGLEEFSSEQMLFIAYAQSWCDKSTTEGLLNQVLTDPHSPGRWRIIGPLSNSYDFVEHFQCPPGSPMNRDDKCILW